MTLLFLAWAMAQQQPCCVPPPQEVALQPCEVSWSNGGTSFCLQDRRGEGGLVVAP